MMSTKSRKALKCVLMIRLNISILLFFKKLRWRIAQMPKYPAAYPVASHAPVLKERNACLTLPMANYTYAAAS